MCGKAGNQCVQEVCARKWIIGVWQGGLSVWAGFWWKVTTGLSGKGLGTWGQIIHSVYDAVPPGMKTLSL